MRHSDRDDTLTIPAQANRPQSGKAGRRLRLVCAVLLCAAVVTASALTPLLLFRAQDAELFAQTHSAPARQGAGLGFAAEEIPLVRNLYQYEEIWYNGTPTSQTTISERSKEERDDLLPEVYKHLELLYNAEVLPPEVYEYLISQILPLESINFSHYIDTAGIETITCNFGMGVNPPYFITAQVDVGTGLWTSVDMNIPPEVPLAIEDSVTLMKNYLVNYLGLDMVDDWRVLDQWPEDAESMPYVTQLFSDYLKMAAFFNASESPVQDEYKGSVGMHFRVYSQHMASDADLEDVYGYGQSGASSSVPADEIVSPSSLPADEG